MDEANDALKALKAKTVQPEEQSAINTIFRRFFQSINTKDEESLTSTVGTLLTSFLGKADATKNDVATFLQKALQGRYCKYELAHQQRLQDQQERSRQ